MASGGLFQTVGAAEKKRRTAFLVRDLVTISNSILADPHHSMAHMASIWRAKIPWLIELVWLVAQGDDF